MDVKNYKLVTRIYDRGYTQHSLSAAVGMTPLTMSLKLRNLKRFRLDEVYAIANVLEIPYSSIHIYFPPEKYKKENKA